MGWRKDKKFWYYGVSLKSQIFKEGLPKKTKYRGGLLKGEGLGQFADLREGLAKKKGGIVFEREGVDTPMHAMMTKLSPITFAK